MRGVNQQHRGNRDRQARFRRDEHFRYTAGEAFHRSLVLAASQALKCRAHPAHGAQQAQQRRRGNERAQRDAILAKALPQFILALERHGRTNARRGGGDLRQDSRSAQREQYGEAMGVEHDRQGHDRRHRWTAAGHHFAQGVHRPTGSSSRLAEAAVTNSRAYRSSTASFRWMRWDRKPCTTSAGIATASPSSVATRTSEMPLASLPALPVPNTVIRAKVLTMPTTVPSKPMRGAAVATTASNGSRRSKWSRCLSNHACSRSSSAVLPSSTCRSPVATSSRETPESRPSAASAAGAPSPRNRSSTLCTVAGSSILSRAASSSFWTDSTAASRPTPRMAKAT